MPKQKRYVPKSDLTIGGRFDLFFFFNSATKHHPLVTTFKNNSERKRPVIKCTHPFQELGNH